MEIHHILTSEDNLEKKYQTVIKSFWSLGRFSSFQGVDDIRINFATFTHPNHVKNLVIVQGRSESYIKYQEFSYDFYQQGYNIFILDHRGQGLSERMLDNPHKGYVKDFDDYANDLNTFVNTYVLPYCHSGNKPNLIAHSMGCAIASLYLMKHPGVITSAIFSSPMFAINMGKLSPQLATGIINFSSSVEKILANTACYFPGQKNHAFKEFNQNKLSHSKIRYKLFKELYQKEKAVQLGGVTIQWLKKAQQIKHKIFERLELFNTPVMVLQAGDDTIVANTAQDEFCMKLHTEKPNLCYSDKPIKIEGAWHELFFEKDEYRTPALNYSLSWFEKNT